MRFWPQAPFIFHRDHHGFRRLPDNFSAEVAVHQNNFLAYCTDAIDIRQIGVDMQRLGRNQFFDSGRVCALNGELCPRFQGNFFRIAIKPHGWAFNIRHNGYWSIECFARFVNHGYIASGFFICLVGKIEPEDIDAFADQVFNCRKAFACRTNGRNDLCSLFHTDAP